MELYASIFPNLVDVVENITLFVFFLKGIVSTTIV